MMRSFSLRIGLFAVGSFLLLAACDQPPGEEADPSPNLQSQADTLAFQMYEALGGPTAWEALPYLRFDFAIENENGDQNVVARHFWDRQSDDYRVEWYPGDDTTYVALFNIQEHEEGTVYLNGAEVGGDREDLLETAHRRFINDSYWALAPVKAFDEGVNREYMADSSDAEHEVLHLSFGDVGLTPGDQYWMYVDTESHRLDRWAFVLQRAPDSPPSYYRWREYEELDTPEGPVYVATRKQSEASGSAILTPVYDLTEEERENLNVDPEPRLD